MAELRCTSLAKSYGTRAVLREVDLVVPEGTLTAILGASGSGKTTLLRLIIGFIAPDRGTIEVDGTVVAAAGGLHVAPDKREIGYVAQEGALFPHLTVAENVAFGLPRGERKNGSRTNEALDLVGLGSGYAARRPHELSGGEQRRVGLARALAPKPRIVLLDEPFSGLDAHLRAETREAVTRRWPRRARLRCSSPTTRPRRCRWGARSPFCARDGSLRRQLQPSSTARRSISTSRVSSVTPSSFPELPVPGRRLRARTPLHVESRPLPARWR